MDTGGRYNPSVDSWVATSIANAPEAREIHTGVWTGSEMIVWGGISVGGTVNTGGRYDPSIDTWTATSTVTAPTSRLAHTAVWTGSEMIVWGGELDFSTPLNTGGRYNPSTDSWVATSTSNVPAARAGHTAVLSDSEMIVWGGASGAVYWNTGGRYNPNTDSWTATSVTNAPISRGGHTAVWTGNEMIVWGGEGANFALNTGGRYCGKYPPPTPTPPTITVTNTNDSGPDSLRQALADANNGDIIGFAVTGTIGLTSGELLVTKNVTISGPGADNLAINGNAKSRVFHIGSGKTITVSISGLTITNGYAGGGFPDDIGGGIYNDHAALTVNDCAIEGNYALVEGGGIYNDATGSGRATLQISNSKIKANGGGILNDAIGDGQATVQITSSSITDNIGAGILSRACHFACGQATISIESSTLSGNSNGIISELGLGVTNSTLSGNGGLAVETYIGAVISNSTEGSGADINNNGGVVAIENTVLKIGASGQSIVNSGGDVKSLGYNLSSDDGGGYLNGLGDQINIDPFLGPLQDNGGPTFTHALLPGSLAINAGDPNFVPPPDYDQRGPDYDRVSNGRLDIGSFEVQTAPRPSPTPRVHPTPRVRPTPR